MHTVQATGVARDPVRAPKRLASSVASFASGLRDGLADLAHAFDGVFRAAGSLSLGERAAYGLWSHVKSTASSGSSGPEPRTLNVGPIRRPSPKSAQRPERLSFNMPCERSALSSQPVAVVEGVRREAKLRRASSSDASTATARRAIMTGARETRIRAKVGPARVDVVVYRGGRLASAMQWMR